MQAHACIRVLIVLVHSRSLLSSNGSSHSKIRSPVWTGIRWITGRCWSCSGPPHWLCRISTQAVWIWQDAEGRSASECLSLGSPRESGPHCKRSSFRCCATTDRWLRRGSPSQACVKQKAPKLARDLCIAKEKVSACCCAARFDMAQLVLCRAKLRQCTTGHRRSTPRLPKYQEAWPSS